MPDVSITLKQYLGPHAKSKDVTQVRRANAVRLLATVNALLLKLVYAAVPIKTNPATGTIISGQTFGGFRPQDCPQGAPNSAHKDGEAVDIYDPDDAIDKWMMANQHVLVHLGLFIEHPDATPGWAHLSIRPPKSGKHVFFP